MKHATILAVGALALGVAGCGGGGDTVSSGDRNRFVQACSEQVDMDRAICECLGDAAREELTPGSFAMLLAMVQDDDEASAQIRSQLSIDELTAASMFMVSRPGQCAAGMDAG